MNKLEVFRQFRRAARDPDRIGDVAVLKGELAGGGARPEIEAQLRGMARTFPKVDAEGLRQLPRGTLGREYAEFLHAAGLQPFKLSDQIGPEMLERNIFIARYSLLHDVFHVLTGFDTSWAGEAGVWAFVAAQGYKRGHWIAVLMACLVYPCFAPTQIPRIMRNIRRGIRMGRRSRTLIVVPLETMWERSVDELRRELDIDPAGELTNLVAAPV
jgi:ubiquinone biosynthesis protein Coq4